VVCTHDRPADLERCLGGLARLAEPVEVVVVDSASRRPCRALIERHARVLEELSYVRLEQPGLSLARNAGVAASHAPLVAFVDDDAVPAPDWSRVVRAAFDHPQIGCVGGACRASFAAPRPKWLSERLLQLAGITRFGEGAREPRSSAEWPFGANIAFRRRALEEAGAFAADLGRRGSALLSGEDSDMVARVLAGGWRVWLEPRAIVAHTVPAERCRGGYYWRRLWWNGISRAVNPSPRVSARLLAAVPIRLLLWTVRRDRIYLYRLAESAGYFAARLGLVAR
jgi:cellulose synthase/poly-beta-1,6-N-acetylglucosamine synthase-like glycosyltransferase